MEPDCGERRTGGWRGPGPPSTSCSSVQAVRAGIVTAAAMAVMDMMTALKLPTHMDGFLYPLGELGTDGGLEYLQY